IVLYSSVPCLFLAGIIVAAIVDRIKQGRADVNTGDVLQAGNEIIGKYPKSIDDSIIRSEKENDPIIKENIPSLETETNTYDDRSKYYADKIFKDNVRIEMLEVYSNRHLFDDPDADVLDVDLKSLGYEKLHQVRSDILKLTKDNKVDRDSW